MPLMNPEKRPLRSKHRQQGMALLATWVLVLALVVTIGTIFYRHQLDIARSASQQHTEQALLLALSVENWAGQLLSADYDDQSTDNLLEDWARAVPALPVDGGFISGCINDLQGRFNLNSLAFYTEGLWQEEFEGASAFDEDEALKISGQATTFINLLNLLELPASQAQVGSLIDWTDANGQSFRDSGGEQSAYDTGRQRVMVPNSLIVQVSELGLIHGFNPGMAESLFPFVTALPGETPVNINTAPEALLLALGGEQYPEFANFVLQARPFATLSEFHTLTGQQLGLEIAEVAALWGEKRVSVSSAYFALNLQVNLGTAQLEVTSVLSRTGREEPVVISRTLTRVPAIATGELDEDELALLESPCIRDRAGS